MLKIKTAAVHSSSDLADDLPVRPGVADGLDRLVNFYRDKTLNELPEFKDLNPSIEHFARILCQNLAAHIPTDQLDALSVKIWENDMAWAEFRKKL
jgi:6-pyruvoyltetrahydropterin/6-carboxytetrahydropterin synthase